MNKPLGIKAYGSIGHLIGSKVGTGDHTVSVGQHRICCEKVRDYHDTIIVQEKLDGSCTAVAKINGQIVALGRAGWSAQTSPYKQHQLFALWVKERYNIFNSLLKDGERLVGEWLAQAHGTLYELKHDPWVCFDLMRFHNRVILSELDKRINNVFARPHILHIGKSLSIKDMLTLLEPSHHGAIGLVEGAVWRVERKGKVDFLAKYVRPEKIIGKYLSEVSGKEEVWNWHP